MECIEKFTGASGITRTLEMEKGGGKRKGEIEGKGWRRKIRFGRGLQPRQGVQSGIQPKYIGYIEDHDTKL